MSAAIITDTSTVKPILKSVFEEEKNIMTTLAASLVAKFGYIDFIKAHRHRLK